MIDRHVISRDIESELQFATTKFEKFDKKVRAKLAANKGANLWGFKDLGLRLATYSIITEDKKIVDRGLSHYLEVGVRHLQREFSNQESLNIKLGQEEYTVSNKTRGTGTTAYDWWQLLNMSLILRDEELREQLYVFLDNCIGNSKDPFWKRSIDLMLMCLGKKEIDDSIIENITEIANSGLVVLHEIGVSRLVKLPAKERTENKWLPIMELYFLAYNNEEEKFNSYLAEYLQKKKKWIVDNNENDDSRYWIDLPMLACCSYAYERNIDISVVSEYIPQFVYRGELNLAT